MTAPHRGHTLSHLRETSGTSDRNSMRLKDGNDLFLLVGVWLALFVVVSRPPGRLMAFALEADDTYGQQLLSALVLLAVVLTVHQMWKRHVAGAEARTSAAAAEQSGARVGEMEHPVKF